MDANAQNALLEQLAESSRRSADALESLGAEMVSLRAQVSEVDAQFGELRAMHQDLAERVERLGSELDRLRADRSLGAQIEALRSSQTEAQSQLERLEGQLRRVEHVESSMGQLQREVSTQLDDRERNLRAEITAKARQAGDDGAQVARELRSLGTRVDTALDQQQELDALAQSRAVLQSEMQELSTRIDAMAKLGAQRDEALRRSEQGLGSRLAGQGERLDEVESLVGEWRQRIEQQLETVRESQGIAQQMQVEAERMRRESHAAAEAWRVAEGRVDESLASIRQDLQQRWERLQGERRNDWEAHQRLHLSEQRDVREAREAAMVEVESELEALRQELQSGFEVTGRDLAELKHRLGAYFRNYQALVAETNEAFEVNLPSDDPAAGDPERRQALRRALRARRAAQGS